MANEMHSLFVYGSLRSGFRTAAYQYLAQYFTLEGEGNVRGLLYDKGGLPVAVNTTQERFITGELYHINDPAAFSWAIQQLDDYEGLNTEGGVPPLYKREQVEVFISPEHTRPAWIYWYNGDMNGCTEIPVGDIFAYLQQKDNR